jgi:hypothetical protein
MKNLQKKITEFLPASSTKKSVQNFFLFQISLYIQKTGFFSVFVDGRIKPWQPCLVDNYKERGFLIVK